MKQNKKVNVWKWISNIFLALIVIFVIYLVIEIIIGIQRGLPPCIFNHYIFVVRTNSMENTINVGDVVFVRRELFANVKQDMIISFRDINPADKVYGQYITHRVIDISSKGLTTMGDNNPVKDALLVTESNFLGVVDHISPFLGKVIGLFTTNASVIFIVMIVILLVIVGIEVKNIMMIRENDKNKNEKEKIKDEILKQIKDKEGN